MRAMHAAVAVRHTAEERREEILQAAVVRFGATGLHGTSTETIAADVGVSQPYLFRLFGTKKELFLAAVEWGFRETLEAFRKAGSEATGPHDAFRRIGEAYLALISDRRYLDIQMQAYATTHDPDVRQARPGGLRAARLRGRLPHRRDAGAAGGLPRVAACSSTCPWPWASPRRRPAGRSWCAKAASGDWRSSPDQRILFRTRWLVSSHYTSRGSKETDPMQSRSIALWTFAVTSVALVMVMLDNLVVSTALNVIRQELGATIEQLEWTVNAYTLTFAVFLLTGAALGDRFGRRRMFVIGVAIFTAASALAAMSTSVEMLLVGRMAQGIGAAIVTPLTLTLLSAAVPGERRGVALGAWGAVGGLAIAIGPLVGGAIVEGVAWNWIFWINVPIGIALVPVAWFALRESHGPAGRLDLPGVALASAGLFGVVWALVNGNSQGWTSPAIVAAFVAGVAFLAAFLLWERRAPAPMLPTRFFASRAFSFANLSAMLMSFGMFGAIFLLAQFLQFVRGYSPLEAGAAILPWTLAPMFVAPVAGALSDRIGGGLIMGVGLTLQAIGLAWLGLVSSTTVEYAALVVPFIVSGIGMGLFFAPMANVTLSAGPARGGGPGLRRQQRHPRAGRRLRCRRPGRRLHPQRLVRQPAGLRRRPRAGGAHRLGRGGVRSGGGLRHPARAPRSCGCHRACVGGRGASTRHVQRASRQPVYVRDRGVGGSGRGGGRRRSASAPPAARPSADDPPAGDSR